MIHWFNRLVKGKVEERRQELLIDAEMQALEHGVAAAHHQALADMYAKRAVELKQPRDRTATLTPIMKDKA
jgi:hypothetical protein